jgi:cell wall-associated NlpC family hydrolase
MTGSTVHRRLAAALVSALAATLLGGAAPAAAAPAVPSAPAAAPVSPAAGVVPPLTAAARLTVGRPAWVAVSVTTLWRTPSSPRPVDAPALANPARIDEWLREMTLSQRRGLWHKADTQALYGDRVRVIALRRRWAKVVVPSQPSQLDRRGYPGWVPRRQLTATSPRPSAKVATVLQRTTWLRTEAGASLFKISYGTRLPYLGTVGRFVRVATPTGDVRRVRATTVRVHDRGTPALRASRASLVRMATSFRGLPYLWAGLTGFGFDCSGLTWMDYRVHGITIPRDALPQSRAGRAVRAANRRPGDLLFYATDGVVHHVSMYIGDGMMVHAPGTGKTVEVIPVSTPAYRREYAGARRYL